MACVTITLDSYVGPITLARKLIKILKYILTKDFMANF